MKSYPGIALPFQAYEAHMSALVFAYPIFEHSAFKHGVHVMIWGQNDLPEQILAR